MCISKRSFSYNQLRNTLALNSLEYIRYLIIMSIFLAPQGHSRCNLAEANQQCLYGVGGAICLHCEAKIWGWEGWGSYNTRLWNLDAQKAYH